MSLHKSSSKTSVSTDHSGNLKIGDVVLLYYNADKRFVASSGEKSGFVLADISGSFSQQLLTIQPAGAKDQELPELQLGTFKVVVSNKYEAQTRYKILVEKLQEFKRKNAGESSIQLLQLQVTQAERDSEVERQENLAKVKRMEGTTVSYGDCIQLQHTHTGKYVCVSTTDTSLTENTKLRVFLNRKDSVGCIFRLHPRIKVQTVGEEVNYDDQIKFESVATEGQYLHCSKKTFGDINVNAFSERHELNLSAKDSPLKIIRHYHPRTGKDCKTDNTLKARGIVRFFHRKQQCYFTAEGSFVGHHGYLPELGEDSSDTEMGASLIESNLKRRSIIPSPIPSPTPRREVTTDDPRRKSLIPSPIPSPTPHRMEVRADVEPTMSITKTETHPAHFSTTIAPSTTSSDQEVTDQRKAEQLLGPQMPGEDISVDIITISERQEFDESLQPLMPGEAQPMSGHESLKRRSLGQEPLGRRISSHEPLGRRISGHEQPRRISSQETPGLRKTSVDDVSGFMSLSRRSSRQDTILEEDVFTFTVPDDNQVVSEDVHFRRKHRTHGNLSTQTSSSPNTFWQIEKCGSPSSGEPIQWYESCRIKHLPTRRYLAVTRDSHLSHHYKVTLKSCKLPLNCTIFELFPVVQQVSDEIDYESYVRVKHKSTGTWLHLNKDLRYTPSDMNSANTEEELETEGLYEVIATKDINSDDAFTLEKVNDQLVSDFNSVATITGVLANQLQQCKSLGGKPHLPNDCHMECTLSSLKYLRALLLKKTISSDLKKMQKILRNMKTLVLVVQLINLHRNETSNDPEVATACFKIIIHFLEGKSTKNKFYISGMMRHIFTPSVKNTELIGGLTVTKAVMGIAKDNPNVLYESEVMTRIISYVMQKLKSLNVKNKKVVQLLEILSALCVCKEVPVKQNQIIILKQLQAIHHEGANDNGKENQLLYSVRSRPTPVKGGQTSIEVEETANPQTKFKRKKKNRQDDLSMSECRKEVQYQCLKSDKTKSKGAWYALSDGGRQFYKFFVAQIHLLAAMCRGDNSKVIKTLQQLPGTVPFGVELDFELIMSAIKDPELRQAHPEIIAAFIELLKVMFIEVGENRPFLDKFPFAFKVDEIVNAPFHLNSGKEEHSESKALTGVVNKHFSTIRNWIKCFLWNKSEYNFAADEEEQNGVVVKVLQVLSVLIKFGYYSDSDDVNDLLPTIQKLLNGKEDYPTKQIKQFYEGMGEFRKQFSQMRHAIRRGFSLTRASRERTKSDADELETFKHAQIDSDEPALNEDLNSDMVEETLRKFRERGRFECKQEQKNYLQIKFWAIEVLNLIFNFQLYKSLHNFVHDFHWITQSKIEKDEMNMIENQHLKKSRKELGQLLTKNPRDPGFYRQSPKLAKKIITASRQYLMLISESTGDVDLSNNQELPQILLDLACYKNNDLIQRSLLLLDRYYTSKTDIFQKALQSQLLLTPQSIELYSTVEKLFLKLTSYLRSGSNQGEDDTNEGPSPVKMLTTYCWLEKEVEGFELHQINRNIILSLGIFPDVLNYVLQYCKGPLYLDDGEKEKLVECFSLLRALAYENLTIQAKLLQHLNDFIKAAAGELGFEIGKLLQVVFSGGPSICLSVKEEEIWRIMKLIFGRGKEIYTERNSALLDALKELLMVKDLNLPLRHNQLVVARCISHIREDDRYWCRELLAEGKNSFRHEVLIEKNDSDTRLSSLLMITDLLATCAYGDNPGIDSIHAICCTIYTEEELIDIINSEKIGVYRKRPFMKLLVWVYMNVNGKKADERSHYYRRNRKLWDHMKNMASELLHLSDVMKRFLHSSYVTIKELVASSTWKYTHSFSTTNPELSKSMEDNIDQNEIADLLLYYSEGMLPFLQMFYSKFYQKANHDQSELEGDTTANLYSALLALFASMNCNRVYFPQEIQVHLYHRVLFLLKPNVKRDLSSELTTTVTLIEHTSDVFHQEVVTIAREKYNKLYKEEIELNMKFSKFVRNFKAAYEGRNTRRDQIIDANTKKKILSDKEPYSGFLDEEMTKPSPKYLPLGKPFQEHLALFNSLDSSESLGDPKEKLLKQLEISITKMADGDFTSDHFESERQTELDIKCLQILRAVIYNQIILIDEEDKERDPQKYRSQCEEHLHPIQNKIQDLGNTASRVMPLLSHPNEKLVYEVLAFLEAILEFGNTHVQKSLETLIKSRENQVFPTLKAILKRAAVVYRESQLLISLLKSRSTFDRRITMKVEKLKSGSEDLDNDPDFTVMTMKPRLCYVQEDGNMLLKAPRRGPAIANLFRKTRVVKVVSFGGDNRVPFMALYQHSEAESDIDGKSLSSLQFYDLSRITLISKVLGLMCDGQYKEMQDFLRDQSESIYSVNMVAELATFLYEFSKKHIFSIDILQLFNQLLQALKEFCIGNYKNREVVFNANVVSVINYVLQIDITNIRGSSENTTVITNITELDNIGDDESDQNTDFIQLRKLALEMKASAVELLHALLEEISMETSKLSKQIAEGLDVNALHWSMLDFYILKSDHDLITLKIDDNASRALFDSYRIIMHLVDTGIKPLEKLKPTERSILKAWEFCVEKSRSVEIVYKDEELEEEVLARVHFNANVKSDIRDQLKNEVKLQVDRSTHAEKIRDFHEWMVAVKRDTLHHDSLYRKHLSPIKLFSQIRRWLLLMVILALNILLMFYYNPPVETDCPIVFEFFEAENGTMNDGFSNEYIFSTFALGGVFALLTIWMLLEYFIVTWPHFVLPRCLYTLSDKLERHKSTRWLGRIMKVLLPHVKWTYSSVNFFGVETIYLLLFLPVALSPLYCFNYLYCYCSFYIIINNDILQRALQSVTRNWKSLIWVAALLLIIIYCFSVVSFITLRDEFINAENKFCDTLNQCLITVLRFGLIDNFLELSVSKGTEGSSMAENGSRVATERFFFDITFFIIVTTIGLNIVFGIIVDTFSELRDAKFAAEQDLRSTCFICNLPSHEFDRISNNGFQKHIREDHNMWAYIFYSIYLDQIDVTNHNAIEKYVYEKIKGGSIDYIPFQKALVLQGHKKDEELKEELAQLQQTVRESFSNLSLRLDALQRSRNEQ